MTPHAGSAPQALVERNEWIKVFNRLDAAVAKWRTTKPVEWCDDTDDALVAAHDRILKTVGEMCRTGS